MGMSHIAKKAIEQDFLKMKGRYQQEECYAEKYSRDRKNHC